MASFTGRTAASNDLNDARKVPHRLALLGDSITDFNFDFANYPTSANYHSRGYMVWANMLLRHRITYVHPSTTDGAWGASGMTAATMLTGGQAAAAAASTADVVLVLAGTNDLTEGSGGTFTAAQIAANLQTIWNLQLAAGKQVVACTVMPRNASDDPPVTAKLKTLNRLIRKQATATPGVWLCDWYSVVLDPSTSLANSSAYYIDGIHPNSAGASRLGAALAPVLDRLFPPGADDLALDENDAANYLTTAALMRGTGGSVSQGSGTVANGWTSYGGSNTYSKVTRTDLVPGEWQQVVLGSGGNSTLQTYGNIGGTNQPAVGDILYATCEFETDATGWAGTQIALQLAFNGSSNTTYGPIYAENLVLTRPPSGILRTPNFPVPSGATLWKLNILCNGAGTWRFGRTQLVKPV